MKKLFSFLAVVALFAVCFTSCEQSDCLCKYYNDNQVVGYDTWDGSEVSASECAGMENSDEVENNADELGANDVACSFSW